MAAVASAPAGSPRTIKFARAIGNVEYAATALWPQPRGRVTRAPEVTGTVWYGQIMRRLPEEVASLNTDHYVPFIAEYRDGVAARAWCDADFDGDLTDQPPVQLADYPGAREARSFLVDLRWTSRLDGREVPIDWTVRVVLERTPVDGSAPIFRVQRVHAMMGTVTLEGKDHRAFLMDGTADGFYTRDLLDGMFVDLNDDAHVDVDEMSPEFGSFSVPFTMGRTSYQVESVDPEGRELTLRELGSAAELPPGPAVGKPAPDFSYTDTAGRAVRLSQYSGRCVLVYFWASWCPTCTAQAAGLTQLYGRYHDLGLEILGVSYDTDRRAMESFRDRHGQAWSTSFSGRKAWEDPVGRLYRERGTGALYLIGPSGRLEGIYSDPDQLEPGLAALLAQHTGDHRQTPSVPKAPR